MSSLADTFKTLRFQLLISAIVVIIISLFASWIIAGKLSKPIDNMSEVAEKWANGDSNVVFEGGGYTEMEKLADTLNYAKDEISKTGNLQRDLMANVSHDLKTPLTMIKAYAELIKDISGDNKQKREKHTQIIIDEVDRLTLLVNDILNLSRLQSLVEQFNIQKINFSELVESVVYRFDTLVSNGGYKIVKEIQPDVFICADEKKMEEVVYNLVGNAINYTGEDKTVKVYLTTNNEKVTLEIIDSGKGINAEKMQTIWEKYYRVSETHHREVKGTGLGLSIVKAILDGHLFKYGIVSKEGCGSNFYIEIPVKEIQDE
jgi:signal transduction histidine kinase